MSGETNRRTSAIGDRRKDSLLFVNHNQTLLLSPPTFFAYLKEGKQELRCEEDARYQNPHQE
jgi:hypothetical protein